MTANATGLGCALALARERSERARSADLQRKNKTSVDRLFPLNLSFYYVFYTKNDIFQCQWRWVLQPISNSTKINDVAVIFPKPIPCIIFHIIISPHVIKME